MTPEERDRLVRAETRVDDLTRQLETMRSEFSSQLTVIKNDHKAAFIQLNEKLDIILTKVNQGAGAWWVLTKIGAVLAGVAALGLAVVKAMEG